MVITADYETAKATYSRKQVAQILNVHPNTISRWERDGKVPQPKRLKRTQECVYTAQDIKVLQEYRDAIVSIYTRARRDQRGVA